jgi:hypothetical protein
MKIHAPIFFLSIILLCVQAEDTEIKTKVKPEYSVMSYLAGLVVMLAFVVVPVGMMAYRNRNSIVEFIKNR